MRLNAFEIRRVACEIPLNTEYERGKTENRRMEGDAMERNKNRIKENRKQWIDG